MGSRRTRSDRGNSAKPKRSRKKYGVVKDPEQQVLFKARKPLHDKHGHT